MLVEDARVSVSARHAYMFIKINEKNAYNFEFGVSRLPEREDDQGPVSRSSR